jgi:hypothetical protein
MGKKNYETVVKYLFSTRNYGSANFSLLEKSAKEFFNLFDARGANNFLFVMDDFPINEKNTPTIKILPRYPEKIRCLVPKFLSPLKSFYPEGGCYGLYSTENFTFNIYGVSSPKSSSMIDFSPTNYFSEVSKLFPPKDL